MSPFVFVRETLIRWRDGREERIVARFIRRRDGCYVEHIVMEVTNGEVI